MSQKFKLNELIFEDLISYLHTGETETGLPILIWEYKPEFLNPGLVNKMAQLSERLIRIKHSNILGMISYFTDGKSFYTFHEKPIEFTQLDTLLSEPNQSMGLLWSIAAQVTKAMQVLESEGLAWGGINESHIILDGNQQARLTKIVLPLLVYQAHFDNLPIMDHAPFLAPEFVFSAKYDLRSDVYAFGVLAYRLFSRNWPYEHKGRVVALKKGFEKPMRPFSKINDKIPDRLEKLVVFSLAIDPKERFESFTVMMTTYESDNWGPPPKNTLKSVPKLRFSLQEIWMKWKKEILITLAAGLVLFGFNPVFNLILSSTSMKKSEVPKIVGKPLKEAASELESRGLRYVIAGERVDPNYPPGTVLETRPPEGREVKDGREVRLIVCKGDGQSVVPNLIGKTYSESAEIVPKTMVLNVSEERYSYSIPTGVIISQSPSPNMLTSQPIELVVSGGFPVSVSTEGQSGENLTLNVYTAALKEGADQRVQIQAKIGNSIQTLYDETLEAGEQKTHSFQVKQGSILHVLYNGKAAYKEQL